jgi:hypothetical protein
MKAVYDACTKAQIGIPKEVDDYFDGEEPDPAGVVVDLQLSGSGCVSSYRGNASEGLEVDLKKLPKDMTILRFVNSW